MANFTPQEIEQFLQEFFDVVGTRQYTGARYVPIFGRKGESSIDWDNSAPYEPLTIVLYNGSSYTSRTYVPAGIDISNQTYWAETGAYNSQVEAYRREVIALQEEWAVWKVQTIEDFTEAIDNIPAIIPSAAFSETKTVKKYIDNLSLSLRRGVMVVLGDSWSDESNDPTYSWLNRVATALRMDAYFTNAKPGNGWSHGTNAIPTQVAGALTKVIDGGYTADDVTLVIAFGGVNDYRHGIVGGAVGNGVRTTFTNVRNTFPNAKIQFIVGNTGRWDTMDTLDMDDPNKAANYAGYPEWISIIQRNIQNATPEIAAISCFDAALWLNIYGSSADSNIWNSDNLHPVQIGHNIIAQNIINLLNGIPTTPNYGWQGSYPTPGNHTEITDIPLNVRASVNGANVTITFECSGHSAANLPGTLTWNLSSSQMPRICGGTSNCGYRIPITAYNFGSYPGPIRGYYNAETNVLTIYPNSNAQSGLGDMFGSVSYSLM